MFHVDWVSVEHECVLLVMLIDYNDFSVQTILDSESISVLIFCLLALLVVTSYDTI